MSRIIAGSRRGRRIATPDGEGTRPTSERVREAVFSALAAWAGTAGEDPEKALAGLGFCDLYAGSGAMGLEAASRGADPVLLVESDRAAAEVVRANAADVDLRVRVQSVPVERLVTSDSSAPFDVVWLDPPYDLAADALDRVLADLVAHEWVLPDGMIIVERARRTAAPTWPTGFTGGWERRYGDTVIHFGRP